MPPPFHSSLKHILEGDGGPDGPRKISDCTSGHFEKHDKKKERVSISCMNDE